MHSTKVTSIKVVLFLPKTVRDTFLLSFSKSCVKVCFLLRYNKRHISETKIHWFCAANASHQCFSSLHFAGSALKSVLFAERGVKKAAVPVVAFLIRLATSSSWSIPSNQHKAAPTLPSSMNTILLALYSSLTYL